MENAKGDKILLWDCKVIIHFIEKVAGSDWVIGEMHRNGNKEYQ